MQKNRSNTGKIFAYLFKFAHNEFLGQEERLVCVVYRDTVDNCKVSP